MFYTLDLDLHVKKINPQSYNGIKCQGQDLCLQFLNTYSMLLAAVLCYSDCYFDIHSGFHKHPPTSMSYS